MKLVGNTYRHYKGGVYKVISIATHSESGDDLVVYHSEGNPDNCWARPLSMWFEEVTVEGQTVKRFKLVPTQEKQK